MVLPAELPADFPDLAAERGVALRAGEMEVVHHHVAVAAGAAASPRAWIARGLSAAAEQAAEARQPARRRRPVDIE